jgi:RNA polymerase sigma-70 factor (ECF subfamily)
MNDAYHAQQLNALIAQIGAKNEPAMKQLYDLTAPRMHGLALRIVRQPEWAEDVMQEAYLTVWRTAKDFRSALSPASAWMSLIVRSRALDLLRRKAVERNHLTDELDEVLEESLASHNPTPPEQRLASEQTQALQQCMDKLERRQREVISLAYLRDLTHSELAQQLSLPLGTVKTWIRRGLTQLRGCMSQLV